MRLPTKATWFNRATKIRKATRPVCPRPAARFFAPTPTAASSEIVAAGFRNPYDFAFNPDGEMFTYDADMEWDIGLPWYRPTRVNHVPPGAELGWRSGWAKWPEYYLDSLPATLDVGPGSPTGVEFYNHVAFPKRMQNTMFVGDWSLGQIHAIKFEREGATYKAKITTLLKGRPLNVTDLAVGPDGNLYFCTGGRGTDGGIYRIHWKGQAPRGRDPISAKESSRPCASRSFKATGLAGESHWCRRNWATNGRPS